MKKSKIKALIKETFLTGNRKPVTEVKVKTHSTKMKKKDLKEIIKEEFLKEITTVTKMTKPEEASKIAKAEGIPAGTITNAIKKAKVSGEDVSIAEDTLEGGVSYDSLIGPIISGMVDLKRFVEKEAPEHLNTYKAAEEAIKAFDYAMAYGEEDTLKEDRFVDSSLEDLRQVVRNLAHTTGMGIEEAAEMAMMHIEDMFTGGEELEEVEDDEDLSPEELANKHAGSPMHQAPGMEESTDIKKEEVEDDPGTLAPVGKRTIYGTVEKYTKLPNGQVKVHYDTGDKQVLQKENGAWVEVDYTVNKSITTEAKSSNKSVITKADKIVESFRK